MPVMNMFPGGSTLQIPLEACTAFSASAGNAKVELTWTDPKDKYATPEGDISDTGDQLVSEWDHTVLVRKTGSQPAGPNDGTVVVSSSVRNQYQSTPYTDTGLTNDTTYYYAVFAYNKDGVASEGAFTSATPIAGTPLSQLAEGTLIKILENGSPVEFYLAKHNYEPDLNGAGRELLVRKDTNPYSSYTYWSYRYPYECDYMTVEIGTRTNNFKNNFSTTVQALMATTKFYYVPDPEHASTLAVGEMTCFTLSANELGGNTGKGGTKLPIASVLAKADQNQWTRTVADTINVYYCNTTGVVTTVTGGTDRGKYRCCFTFPDTARVDAGLNLIEE